MSRDWKRCVEIILRLFLPTVNIYGGAKHPPSLSNVVATLRCDASLASFGFRRTVSHRSAKAEQYPSLGGGTPPDIILNV